MNDHRPTQPWASLYRPLAWEQYCGHENVFRKYPFLKKTNFPSLIFHGPPGSGKTTLAKIMAKQCRKDFYTFNPVLSQLSDLKKIMEGIKDLQNHYNNNPSNIDLRQESQSMKQTSMLSAFSEQDSLSESKIPHNKTNYSEAVIFIDEIHRFNKAQQDALLPYLEDNVFTLIGATTENPKTTLNKALLSRVKTIKLEQLKDYDIYKILEKIIETSNSDIESYLNHLKKHLSQEHVEKVIKQLTNQISLFSHGDARFAINTLEEFVQTEINKLLDIKSSRDHNPVSISTFLSHESITNRLREQMSEQAHTFDRSGDRHYNVISALIKSIRGSDPDASLLWLAVLLDAGEDPAFICRRLIILASEDVGNADPTALMMATSAMTAIEKIGMPEARITLAQVVTYLASTHKSNSAYEAINKALSFVAESPEVLVPAHLQNHHPEAKKYRYPHSYPNSFVQQHYVPQNIKLPKFYSPSDRGREGQLRERLNQLNLQKNYDDNDTASNTRNN